MAELGLAIQALGQALNGIGSMDGTAASSPVPGMAPTASQLAGNLPPGITPSMVMGYGPGQSAGQIASDVGSSLSAAGDTRRGSIRTSAIVGA